MAKRKGTPTASDGVIRIYTGFDLHAGQHEVHDCPARFRVLDCGRRWGKTVLALIEVSETAGAGYPAAYMAPTNKMLSETWRAAKELLAPVTVAKNEVEHRLDLNTGGIIDFWSLVDQDSPRGRKYKKVIVDEAAKVKALMETWQAVIWPTLIDYQGAALFLSTPRGHDDFYKLFSYGKDKLEVDWASFKKPTIDNPHIQPSEVDFAQRKMADRIFRQEFLADFIDDAGAVFRNIEASICAVAQSFREIDHVYVIGVDLAKSNDFSVYSVVDVTTGELVCLDRSTGIDYHMQRDRLIQLAQVFQPVSIIVEKNANLAFMEMLDRTDLPITPFQTSITTKAMIIEHLAAAFDGGQIKIIDEPSLVSELHTFTMERTSTGAFRYGAPDGENDDCIMSLALAWYAATYNAPAWEMTMV